MTTDKIAEAFQVGRELKPESLVRFYDKWITDGNYDKIMLNGGYRGFLEVSSHMNTLLQDKGAKILDIGAGTGMVGEQLAKFGFTNIYAVEPSAESISACRKKGAYKEFIQCFIGSEKMPFEDNTFDGAVSSGVFLTGHCDGSSLREAVRLVKPGGPIVIATRKIFYEDHHDDFDLRAVSDELVSTNACSLVYEDIPNYSQQKMGIMLTYTVL